MSFILNTIDLSNKITAYQQVIRPSFALALTTSNILAIKHDYGQNYDTYHSEIDLILTISEYTALKGLIGLSTTFSSDLDLFFPNMTFSNGTSVGIVDIEDKGFYAKNVFTHKAIRLTLKLLVPINPTGTITELQKFINDGEVIPNDSLAINAPDIVAQGFKQSRGIVLYQFVIVNELLTRYQAGEIMKFYMSNRGAKINLNLSQRHCGATETKGGYISDFHLMRNEKMGYYLSLVVTVDR